VLNNDWRKGAEQSRAEQSRAEQSRQSRAEQTEELGGGPEKTNNEE